MDPYVPKLKKPRRCKGHPPNFGYLKIRSCTNDHLEVHICCVFTLMLLLIFLPSCLKGFVVVTQGEDHYPTKQWPRDFGGRICREMWSSVGITRWSHHLVIWSRNHEYSILSRKGLWSYYQSLGSKLRYVLGKVLGTQDRPTLRLALHHCVLYLNLIKNILKTCIYTHTHTLACI